MGGPTLRLADADTGVTRDLFTIRWEDQSPRPVDWPELARWSPDGRFLAVPDARGLWLVDAGTGETWHVRDSIRAVEWHPEGDRLAIAAPDGVFEIDTSGATLKQHSTDTAWWVSWSPDGVSVAYAGAGGLAVVRPSGEQVSLSFSNFHQVVWAGNDTLVRSAADEDRAFVERYDLTGSGKPELVLAVTPALPENRVVLSGDGLLALRQDGTGDGSRVRLWSTASGEQLGEWSAELVGADRSDPLAPFRPGEAGAVVLSRGACQADGVALGRASPARVFVRLWRDDRPGTAITTASWSPSGGRLAFVHPDSGLWIVEAEPGGDQQLFTSASIGGRYPLLWSPDGQRVAGWSQVEESPCG